MIVFKNLLLVSELRLEKRIYLIVSAVIKV